MRKRVLVAGSGGIGRAVALMLRELGELDVDVILADAIAEQAESAAAFVSDGATAGGSVEPLVLPWEGTTPALEKALDSADIILDCLPGGQAPRVAGWALKHGLHYANLTEYVAETNQILEMSQNAETGFALQCGLAPGFVNVLGMAAYSAFCERHGVERIDSLKMRVGAVTRNAESPHFYGFTWSPIGVATEYVKPAIVVRDWKTTTVPSLEEVQTLRIDGIAYEEATTSGGAADLPDALAGKVRHLDYKTLRYPGHWSWVKRQLDAIGDVPDVIRQLQERMQSAVPSVRDDLVVIYAAAEGRDRSGARHRIDEAYRVTPMHVNGKYLRAIQSTTAAGLAECARMLLTGNIRGPLLQSEISPSDYLRGPYVSAAYQEPLSRDLA